MYVFVLGAMITLLQSQSLTLTGEQRWLLGLP
jgi:hypothetical protein